MEQEGSIILAIVGSRTFTGSIDQETTEFILKYGKPSLIVSGGARGVDTLAKLFAKKHQIPFKEFLPDWKKNGKGAGLLRNTDIVKACTHMIAFPDKNGGKGTRDSIRKAKELKKVIKVIEF
jgi:hypothetical protein